MTSFRTVIALFALLPLATGLADVLLGVAGQTTLGVALSSETLADPVLDSQFRFLASIWFGLGLLLCLCAWKPLRYPNVLRGVLAVIFLGGIARILSIVQLGLPESVVGQVFVLVAIAIEIIGMPLLLWWQQRLMKASASDAESVDPAI